MAANSTRIPEAGAGGVPDPFGGRIIYTPKELAKMWKLSENTVRRMFLGEVGVFVLGDDANPRGRRAYRTVRIPEDVAARVFAKRMTK
jgi:hypothetical protein